MKLLKSDTVVHVLVACTEKCLNDVLWDLQRGISLVQVLGRTLIVTTINDLFHTHGEEGLLSFKGGLLDCAAVPFGFLFLLHSKNVINNVVTLLSIPRLFIMV
jgi:hypothetical protein